MARLIKTSVTQDISCNIVTKFTSGEESVKNIKVGDMVEDLRYIQDKAVHKVTGVVKEINYKILKITRPDTKNPKDSFADDVQITNIVIDASEQYASNIVTVPAMEIVEDEGVVDVDRMFVFAYPRLFMQMEYTDGSIEDRDLEVGDILKDMKILAGPGKPDITGDFTIPAFLYISQSGKIKITGLYLFPLSGTGNLITAVFDNIISFVEIPQVNVKNTSSLSDITAAFNLSETGEVYATLGVDVTIPDREDGKITTTMINEGQTLNLDLGGHSINTKAYAFYVNGGTLNIDGEGEINCNIQDKAYPAIYVAANGECNMNGGLIDTTNVDVSDDHCNWIYGVACSGNGIFNMTGGKMVIGGAAGISITNGTATGEGARFTIGGDAIIESKGNAAVYIADNKSVVIKDNAQIIGGIVARMGDITVQDNAQVIGHSDPEIVSNVGAQACVSGVDAPAAAILGLTGVYGSDLGNDFNVSVASTAKVEGKVGAAVEVALVNTKFDQKALITIESADSLSTNQWRVYSHDELAALAQEAGKTLGPETNATDLRITIGDAIVYPTEPPVDDTTEDEPTQDAPADENIEIVDNPGNNENA